MRNSEQVNELAKALNKVQAVIEGAVKDARNPHFKSTFATLESVWDAARRPLVENGLAVVQLPDEASAEPGGSVLVTTILHTSGQWMSAAMPLMPVKNDPQAQGSAITYARRYALAAALGIIQTDDDGESAQGRGVNAPAASGTPAPAKQKATPKGTAASDLPKPGSAQNKAPPRVREELNRILMNLYRPYLTAFPQTQFDQLLKGRYEVAETRLMTVEQLEDLVNFMEVKLAEAP